MTKLTSNEIKKIKSLKLKKFRTETGLFVIEGYKSVQEAIDWIPEEIQQIYSTDASTLSLENERLEIIEISEKEMARITHLKTASPHLVVAKIFEKDINHSSRLALALDGIQDPGNLGTIIRIADWFGVTEITCSADTVDCFNSKVVQATMGSLFRVSIRYTDLAEHLKNSKVTVLGAFMEGTPMKSYQLSEPSILVLGNEGKGISETVSQLITSKISIPGNGHAESLNVGVAAGILVSHLV